MGPQSVSNGESEQTASDAVEASQVRHLGMAPSDLGSLGPDQPKTPRPDGKTLQEVDTSSQRKMRNMDELDHPRRRHGNTGTSSLSLGCVDPSWNIFNSSRISPAASPPSSNRRPATANPADARSDTRAPVPSSHAPSQACRTTYRRARLTRTNTESEESVEQIPLCRATGRNRLKREFRARRSLRRNSVDRAGPP